MPNGDTNVIVPIQADNRPLKQTLKETSSAIQQESQKWDDTIEKSAGTMGSAFDGMLKKVGGAFAAAKVADVLKDWAMEAVNAASDLAEVQNVVDVTFGESAAEIDRWAKTAITQFGLTETKAKQFASTMGAMMKSSGLAGPEIVQMSESLAGLAADMSSFYNMDFDEAFQKIRSGISGETEPLKQLGINMSVANLEAYALQQGITKAFDKMSQSEQIMLRYQYLMQATADAQGDFARTSDGYANGLRLLESNIDSIKTKLGTVLIPIFEQATGYINSFLTAITQEKPKTVFEAFNEIDLDTESKLAEIQQTATEARNLIEIMEALDDTDVGAGMKSLAEGANVLDASSPGTWKSLLGALKQATGLDSLGDNATKAGGGIENLALALSGTNGSQEQATAFNSLIASLSENAGSLVELTGKDEGATREWLSGIAESANALSEGKGGEWNTLLTALVEGMPGLGSTEAGKSFFEAMAQNFLAMGNQSEVAQSGLSALGWSTDQISQRQAQWLEVCRSLVATIPGLSEIINTETGEVQGGTSAIREHVDAWQKAQEKIILWEAYYAKESALLNSQTNMNSYRLDVIGYEQAAKRARDKIDEIRKKYGLNNEEGQLIDLDVQMAYGVSDDAVREYNATLLTLQDTEDKLRMSKENLAKEEAAYADKVQEVKDIHDGLVAQYGEVEDAEKGVADGARDAADAVREFDDAESKLAEGSIKEAEKSLKSLYEYMDKVYSSTYKSIESSLGGFKYMMTPAEEARQKIHDVKSEIEDLQAAGKSTDTLELKMEGYEEAVPTIQSITRGLRSQVDYLQQYIDNIATMRALGFSDDVMAMVSDGSPESADYAAELAKANKSQVDQINAQVQQVKVKNEELAQSLTENKLAVDESLDGLVADWQSAIESMNQYGGAKDSVEQTMQGIIDGLGAKAGEVEAQVTSILAMIASLAGADYGVSIPGVNFNASVISGPTPVLPIQVNSSLNLDGRVVAQSVSQYQAYSSESQSRAGVTYP